MQIRYIKEKNLSSTNSYSADLLKNGKNELTVVYTNFQTKGRGLGENFWYSDDNENLLLSVIDFPEIKIENHFCLNMVISLAICDYLNLKGVLAKIKWPNDIYVENSKIAGILVENNFYGDIIKSTIIGIGLNLNQIDFPNEIPNPISLKKITDIDFIVDDEVKEISEIIFKKIKKCKNLNFDEIKTKYLRNLYKMKIESKFKIDDHVFAATIIDVKKDGHLVIIDNMLQTHEYYFKEIEYVI
jgi:BirA family biotin operon repressor/biotin-[acetyl-CoA-carboxylase] ligase